MKNFILGCLCLSLSGLFSPVQAGSSGNGKAEESTLPARNAKCLVLTNTGHFEGMSPAPLRELMEKEGGVDYDCMSNLSTLTLDKMNDYDVVWVFNFAEWTDYGGLEPKKLGDLLGNYVAGGGRLLECMYVSYSNPQNYIGLREGRYIEEEMSPFEPSVTILNGAVNMGEVVDKDHPIMKDIAHVSAQEGVMQVEARSDAKVLAYWDIESPLVAIRGNVVAVNIGPVQLNVSDPTRGPGSWVAGHAYRLMSNSIKWLFSQKYDLKAPNVVTELTAVPAPANGGAFDIKLTWKNPVSTIEGGALTAIDSVCIYRDGKRLAKKTAVTAGGTDEYVDANVPEGVHEYQLIVYSKGLVGYPAKVSSYSGKDTPAAVSQLLLYPDGNFGHLTWKAPVAGIHGGWIDLDALKYKIVRLPEGKVVEAAFEGTDYVDKTITEKAVYAYAVTPFIDGLEGPTDTSYAMTLYTDGAIYMGTSDITICDAKFYDPAGPENYAHDGQAYFLTIRPEHPENGERTCVSFSEFDINSVLYVLDGPYIDSPEVSGSPFTGNSELGRMKNITAGPANTTGALSFLFVTDPKHQTVNKGWVADISCVTLKTKDLSAVGLRGQLLPALNAAYIYRAAVWNAGTEAQTAFTVKFFEGTKANVLDEKIVAETLKPGDTLWVEFPYTPKAEGQVNLGYEIDFEGDENTDNNVSKPLALQVLSDNVSDFRVGEGDMSTAVYGPIIFMWQSSVTENIYSPAELGIAKGEIRAIRYYTNFIGSEVLNEYLVMHISETNNSNLAYGWIDTADMTKVYSGIVSFPQGQHEITLVLDKPYKYTGKNLVVRLERPFQPKNKSYSLSETFYISSTMTDNRQLIWKGDAAFDINRASLDGTNYAPHTGFVVDCKGAARLEGTITNGAGEALKGVKVSIDGLPFVVYSDTLGRYVFPSLNAGSYTVRTEKFDYINGEVKVSVEDNKLSVKDIVMREIPKVTVQGQVKDNSGEPVVGATVSLDGYAYLSATTDAEGKYLVSGVYTEKEYVFTVSKDLFAPYTAPFVMGMKDTTLALVTITQLPLPALNIEVAYSDQSDSAVVTWINPANLNFNRIVYDDGTAEDRIGVQFGQEGWFGTIFTMSDTGFLCSIDVFGAQHPYVDSGAVTDRTVSIDIFDGNRKLLCSSEPFLMPADEWTTVEFPYFRYTGPFYAMVHYDRNGTTESHMIGCDDDGPYSGAELNYFTDGQLWGPVQTFSAGVYPFCFMIRANVLSASEGMISLSPGLPARNSSALSPNYDRVSVSSDAVLSDDIMSVIEMYQNPSSQEASGLTAAQTKQAPVVEPKSGATKAYGASYDLYRLKGSDLQNQSAWTKLTTTSSDNYRDDAWGSLAQGSYYYAIQAKYGSELQSEFVYSDVVYKAMLTTVNLTFESNSPKLDAAGVSVTLTNMDNDENHIYTATTDENGRVTFKNIWKGKYAVSAFKIKFDKFDSVGLDWSTEAEYKAGTFTMKEELRAPYNLAMNPVEGSNLSEWNFSWNESRDIVDGLESHIDFAANSPGKVGWSYRDVHGVYTYAVNGVTYDHYGEPCAFLVFNPTQTEPAMTTPEIAPYRGKKFLACFSSPEAPNDKWIISPKLQYTNDFTFSFWARSFDASNGLEKFQVGYSVSGTDEKDFVWVSPGAYTSVLAKWTQFSYTIPGRASYVALRCVSNDQYIFMVDELFIGDEQEDGSDNVLSYKIYLDGAEVATTTDKTYRFTNITDPKSHKAGVAAVYSSGISAMVETPFSGVGNEVEDLSSALRLYPNPAGQHLFVEGLTDIEVLEIFNIQGQKIKSLGAFSGNSIVVSDLRPGTYVLRAITKNGVAVGRFVKQ